MNYMMIKSSDCIAIDTSSLAIECRLVPWDAEAFGFPVAQIDRLEVRDGNGAKADFRYVLDWADREKVQMMNCRLDHGCLRESFFLEDRGFRFVEMVIAPTLTKLELQECEPDSISIDLATQADVAALALIAEQAFGHERYHMDPRLDRSHADQRYGNWVRRTVGHNMQKLLKVTDGARVIGVFIVEIRDGRNAYWHLTAIAPQWQGQGYGRRVWCAMLRRHGLEGCASVTTNVSVRNVAVLNLYARLGFAFLPPQMTFHWLRDA